MCTGDSKHTMSVIPLMYSTGGLSGGSVGEQLNTSNVVLVS